MLELITTYHFNDVIDERLRKIICDSVTNRNLDPKKLFEYLENLYQVNKSYMNNPSAYMYKAFRDLDLNQFKDDGRKIIFPTWILGTDYFRHFTGEEIDRYLFGSVIEHVLNTKQKENGQWIHNLLESMNSYCYTRSINRWDELLKLLVTSNALSGCKIPLDELRKELQVQLDEWHRLIGEISEDDSE